MINIFEMLVNEYYSKSNISEPGVLYLDKLKQSQIQNIPSEDVSLEELILAFPDEDFFPKTSKDFLKKCIEVQDERASEYEQNGAERSFNKVATAFNAITGKNLSAAEIALILQILKDVRAWSAESLHMDSLIDGISYASLKAELLVDEHRRT